MNHRLRVMSMTPRMVRPAVGLTLLAAFALAATTLVRPAAAGPKTVVSVLAARSSLDGFDSRGSDYDILIKAVQTADLVDALNDPDAKLTVFAPNDAAFMRTAKSLGFGGGSEEETWNFLVTALTGLGDGDPIPVLKNILLYHVAPERLGPVKVILSGEINTLLDETFGVKLLQLVDKDPQLPNPYLNPFALNINAGKSVIHGITRVLLPVDVP